MVSMPPLPDDVLLIIFGNLSTKERRPLGTSCKRFRNLDIDVGKKKFDRIAIVWNFYGFEMISYTTGRENKLKIDNISYRYDVNPVQVTNYDKRLFRKASADVLVVKINKANCDQHDFQLILSILATLRFRKLIVKFICGNDSSGSFVSTLLSNGIDMICEEVNLSWDDMRSNQEIAYIKKTLLTLPRIGNLNLTGVAFSDLRRKLGTTEHFLIIEDVLIHITSQTKHAVIDRLTGHNFVTSWKLVWKCDEQILELFAPCSEVQTEILGRSTQFEVIDVELFEEHLAFNLNGEISVDMNKSISRVRLRKSPE